MSGLECYECHRWFGHCQCKKVSNDNFVMGDSTRNIAKVVTPETMEKAMRLDEAVPYPHPAEKELVMYTKEYDVQNDWWEILDPEGDHICYVVDRVGADALLSHLNRG